MDTKFNFSSKFRLANIFSLVLFVISVVFIIFKGLNYGIDFKGGTLIELRSNNTDASTIRSLLNNMDLGDVNVKNFGQDGDYLIKVEQKESIDNKIIPQLKKNLSDNLSTEVNFRRVENVGPKVSSELLQSGIIAISLSLAAMLFYIWIRFEWQWINYRFITRCRNHFRYFFYSIFRN
jgi:preprotein translocase subunit SecF